MWRRLRRQDSAAVIELLEAVFFECGAQSELLADNDTAFRSKMFWKFTERWGIRIHFRCAYAASGNDIVERCHRSVMWIAARKGCLIAEAVYWYSMAPKDRADSSTVLANKTECDTYEFMEFIACHLKNRLGLEIRTRSAMLFGSRPQAINVTRHVQSSNWTCTYSYIFNFSTYSYIFNLN